MTRKSTENLSLI